MLRTLRLLSLFALILLDAKASIAQVTTGTPPFGSFSGSPDVVNLANLNAHLTIPVFNKAGRGIPFYYNLQYDTSTWYPVTVAGSTTWTPVINWGLLAQTAVTTGELNATFSSINCMTYIPLNHTWVQTGESFNYGWISYIDAWGISHPINATSTGGWGTCSGVAVPVNDITVTSPDGSGFTLATRNAAYSDTVTITARDGTVTHPPINVNAVASTYTDRNGNQISVDGSGNFTDTLGTLALAVSGSGTPSSPMKLTYTPPSGNPVYVQVNYANYTIATNFGISTIHEYKSSGAVPLVTSIVLPDGSLYSFNYESTPSTPAPGACTPYAGTTCVTARLAGITLPTGGTIAYTYTGGNNGILSDGSTSGLNRIITDGASWSATWTYSRTQVSGTHWQTTINDPTTPTANQTIIDFQGLYETKRVTYQGSSSGTLLQTINTCYNGATSPCTGTAVTLPITHVSQLVAYPDTTGKVCEHDQYFNAYGLKTEQDDYDYGTGAPASTPLRKAIIVYSTSLTNGIVDMPSSITIQDGGGNTKAQTTFAYDETTPTASSPVSPQWTSISGSRGNATTIRALVQGSTFLTQTNSYYDTGNVYVSTGVNGAPTTYSYSGTSCGNAFPTSISEPLSMSRSMTWHCTGGVQLTSTDENSKTVTTTYNDPYFWRPNAQTDQIGNQTSLYYQPNPTYCCPTEVASFLVFNNGNSLVSDYQYKDGLGRTYVDQHLQSPGSSTLDSVSYAFDSNGRPYSVSTPCAISYAQTCSTPKTTQTYDALNRPLVTTDGGGGTMTYSYSNNDVLVTVGPAPSGENTKRRQLEYDSIGRLTSVCELTTLSGSGTCGQTNSQTGYWTKYSYDALGNLLTVTQNAQASSGSQQTRNYSFDAASRLTSETNAENGTTTYAYDSDATCGSSAGDLVKTTDAIGNVTCRTFDALHRVTSITYPSGPYMSVTPMKVFYYDTSHFNTTSNTKGRLASAGTCSNPTCAGPWITAEDFSYSARGEQTDLYEWTTNSGAWYHTTQSYWANGAPNVLSGLPGLPTITYGGTIGSTVGLDGEGRITQVTASSGQNPATGVTYNTASLPVQVNLGSGDSDIFGYDSNTLRMSQYQFRINSQSVTSSLAWNANGTLGQLAITDPFSSANTQTCNYSHDDLTRIASANCGSAAAQTFSYDPFGNLSKSGSPYSFNPAYSTSTNHMTSIGSFTPTYDSNGNVINDSLHAYAWDADSNSVTVDGVGLTFDALDRMVEQNRSGTYTQIAYSPGGAKLALMSGQTLQKAFVRLPGTATAVYTASAPLDHYQHADWLGSSRLGSQPSPAPPWSETAYAPFGEPYAQSGATDLSFTGQNSDTTSGDYDFLFREYSMQGRWASPDPAGLAAVDPSNPQSWNRYTYVLNDPTDLADPLGLCAPGTICVISVLCPGGPLTCSSGQGSSGPSGLGSLLSGGGNPDAPFLSCGGFVEANCAPPPPPLKCVRPSAFQRAGISIQGAIAASTGTAVGVGAGATVAGGNKIGITLSISRQIVVTPDGQAAFVTTFTPIAPTGFNSYVSPGVGGYGGFQLSFSNAQNPQNLGGGGFNIGYGGGRGWGGGVDGSVGWSNNGPIFQATFTAGAGLGVPGATGHGLAPIYTLVTPICAE